MTIRTFLLKRSKAESREIDWEAVYQDQLPRIYNYFRYRLGDEALAKDLTADTFERAWRKRHLYHRDLSAFSTWLFQIARNLAIDHYRKVVNQTPLETVAHLETNHSLEDIVEQRYALAHLRTLLAQLSERDQELVALKYGAGHTNRQIAHLTGLTETNVGSILYRVVRKLRAQWEIE